MCSVRSQTLKHDTSSPVSSDAFVRSKKRDVAEKDFVTRDIHEGHYAKNGPCIKLSQVLAHPWIFGCLRLRKHTRLLVKEVGELDIDSREE